MFFEEFRMPLKVETEKQIGEESRPGSEEGTKCCVLHFKNGGKGCAGKLTPKHRPEPLRPR